MEEFSRLCCLIVEDVYGGFLAQIFKILIQLGRLSASQVAQKCRLPQRQVRTGLATLIQLRLVYHHTTSDGSLSTYQANSHNAYNLVRLGKLLALVERSYGHAAATLMEHLATLGYGTADDLEAHIRADQESPAPRINGHSATEKQVNGDLNRRDRFIKVLKVLIDNQYIAAVRDAHFQSLFDARQDIERQYRGLGMASTKTKKSQLEFDMKVDVELEKRLDPTVSAAYIMHELISDNSDGPDTNTGQGKTLLCVDYQNVVKSIRTERLAPAAARLLGREFATITQAVCSQIELDSNPFTIRSLEDPMASKQRIDTSLLAADVAVLSRAEDAEDGSLVDGYPTNGYHTPHTNGTRNDPLLNQRLAVLAGGPFRFISQDFGGSFLVDRKQLGNYLRDQELLRLMSERVDGPALRIMRMLSDKGKLDEKALQEVGLLSAKDLRQCLAQLQVKGFLELQEVPREAQRQPNRTIFLWFYDAERVRKVFLGQLFKAMARLFQRLHLERTRLSSTLSKIERTDVQGSEEEILPAGEFRLLSEWREKEIWFTAELERLDDSVAMLRDL
ncbi:DNA-directed RNA polymerase III subunit C3 [Exophiala viscosa]|uniref:DNA-directed RNA polymerase III subunit RPC3 n=1 Tax=Exophiala viscosa TaxID=2486360 RepID=A0AAN6DY65_9EURO|nr:DNA-directed RNA polymerase III subunit C3 [Exophiala viscosa]KAI1624286.1 DNA-directed RNA polymerase III subunit C3 [Exophiala viscosa]